MGKGLGFTQIVCGLLIGLLANPAQSIGLGKLSLNSVIGEPLHITIPLLSVSPAQLAQIKVRLAPPSTYSALGWSYPDSAQWMEFKFESFADGETNLIVTTSIKVTQTILTLVIRLTGPSGGEMQREFTVLLDPPEYAAALSDANVLISDESNDSAQVTTALEIPASTISAVNTETKVFTEPSTNNNSRVTQALINGGVVIVKPGDSLSVIAELFLPQGASKYQAWVAFFDANPQAFANQNINMLLSGQRLIIPSAEAIHSYPRNRAKQRYSALLTPDSSDNTVVTDAAATTATTATTENISPLKDIGNNSAEEDSPGTSDSLASNSQITSQTDEVGLRVLPVKNDVSVPAEELQANNIRYTTKPQAGREEIQDNFTIQGFSTRIKYMDAFLVELQDENRKLKEQLTSLQKTVGELVSLVPVSGLNSQQLASLDNLRQDIPAPIVVDESEDGASEDSTSKIAVEEETISEKDTLVVNTPQSEAPTDGADQLAYTVPLGQSIVQNIENNISIPNDDSEVLVKTDDSLSSGEIVMLGSNIARSSDTLFSAEAASSEDSADNLQATANSTRFQMNGGLLSKFRSLINLPIILLCLAFAALVAVLYRYKRKRDEKKIAKTLRTNQQINTPSGGFDRSKSMSRNDMPSIERGQGVSYLEPDELDGTFLSDDIFSSEEKPEPLERPQSAAVIDIPDSNKVDSATESDVFMKYDRPDLAIQVLDEEYKSGNQNQGSIAIKLLETHEILSKKVDADHSIKDFIQKLYEDRDQFDDDDWGKIENKIDQLENP